MNRSRSRSVPRTEAAPKKKSERNFIASAIVGALTLVILNIFAPDLIPVTSTQVWAMHGTVAEWLTFAWPIFAWGGGVTFLLGVFRQMSYAERQVHAGHQFLGGLVISVWAGLVEEVCFRWLIFLPAIAWTMLWNWIFGGWTALILIGLFFLLIGATSKNGLIALVCGLGAPTIVYAIVGVPPGIPEWIHIHGLGFLADATTGGYLHEYLYHSTGFAVGAAMLYANAFFRDGHKYLGLVGVLNSWFLGMFFFYVMFTFGLPAAILIHFAYDAVVFSTGALILAWRNDL